MEDESDKVNRDLSPAAWTALEVLLGVFLALYFWPALMQEVLNAVGWARWYYGEQTNEMTTRLRLGLWSYTLALPFQVVTIPLLFAALHRTRPEQYGLTTRHFGRNILTGFAGWLVLTPLVFGVYWLVRTLYGMAGERGIESHALEIIAQEHLSGSEWVLLFVSAIIAAPVREELTFRGVVQSWLATRRWGGHAAMLLALAWTVLARGERLLDAWGLLFDTWRTGIASLIDAAIPTLFVLGLMPLYLLVWWKSRTPLYPAIFGTALLFACIHTSVWPTPVPLFVLGLGLGMLAQRTQSLIGPIVLHGLFNGISCVQLLWEHG